MSAPDPPAINAKGELTIRRAATWALLPVLEARPVVQVVFLLRFGVGARLAVRPDAAAWPQPRAVLAWWLAVVAVYLWNGVMDFPEDVANHSNRPIARGSLPRPVAVALVGLAAILAVLCSITVHGLWIWTTVFLLLGWAYSSPPWPTKRRSSTAAVTVFGLGGSSYVAGAAATGSHLSTAGVIVAAAGSMWMAGVGTLLKDLSDVTGDAASGRRSLAVRRGVDTARTVAAAFALAVGTLGVTASLILAPRSLAGTVPFFLGALGLAWRSKTAQGLSRTSDRYARRGPYRGFMLTQYAANLLVLAMSV